MSLEERNAQVLATTQQQRDDMDESNPIVFAESGPNRFYIMSLFFSDSDGVRIQEDLDLNDITIHYFTDEGETEIDSGPVYDWALDFYKHD